MASRSRTSFSMSWNARPSAARKHTEPTPDGTSPEAASSVIAADGSANSASRLGWTGLVRPSRVSRNPTYWPSCLEIFASSASRRSSDGWVENMMASFGPPVRVVSAGAK